MTTISFFIPGAPRAKQRHRFGGGHSYTPRETVVAEKTMGMYAKLAMGNRPPFKGPVSVIIEVYYARPKSWPKKRKDVWKTSKPDVDNLVKLGKDSMNRIVWLDDAQVVSLFAFKRYTSEKEVGMYVTVQDLGDQDAAPPLR